MSRHAGQRLGPVAIFLIPVLLAIVTLIGLIAGLLGDGMLDLICVLGVALPLAAIALCLIVRGR